MPVLFAFAVLAVCASLDPWGELFSSSLFQLPRTQVCHLRSVKEACPDASVVEPGRTPQRRLCSCSAPVPLPPAGRGRRASARPAPALPAAALVAAVARGGAPEQQLLPRRLLISSLLLRSCSCGIRSLSRRADKRLAEWAGSVDSEPRVDAWSGRQHTLW